jgi:hypothetical protein
VNSLEPRDAEQGRLRATDASSAARQSSVIARVAAKWPTPE